MGFFDIFGDVASGAIDHKLEQQKKEEDAKLELSRQERLLQLQMKLKQQELTWDQQNKVVETVFNSATNTNQPVNALRQPVGPESSALQGDIDAYKAAQDEAKYKRLSNEAQTRGHNSRANLAEAQTAALPLRQQLEADKAAAQIGNWNAQAANAGKRGGASVKASPMVKGFVTAGRNAINNLSKTIKGADTSLLAPFEADLVELENSGRDPAEIRGLIEEVIDEAKDALKSSVPLKKRP